MAGIPEGLSHKSRDEEGRGGRKRRGVGGGDAEARAGARESCQYMLEINSDSNAWRPSRDGETNGSERDQLL